MIPARPDKWRGAEFHASVTGNAITAVAAVYFPPPSGAMIKAVGCDLVASFGVVRADRLITAVFVAGNSVEFTDPTWGADYAPTGVFQGGRITTVPFFYPLIPDGFELLEFYCFPPNIFFVANQIANVVANFSITVAEFPSAEELNRWRTSPA